MTCPLFHGKVFISSVAVHGDGASQEETKARRGGSLIQQSQSTCLFSPRAQTEARPHEDSTEGTQPQAGSRDLSRNQVTRKWAYPDRS